MEKEMTDTTAPQIGFTRFAKTNYQLIDNFLPSDAFNELKTFLLPSEFIQEDNKKCIYWQYVPNVATQKVEDWRLFCFVHMIYDHTIMSPLYDMIIPHLESLDIKALIRIKINMYPNTEILKEHGMHTDFHFSHKVANLSINTCDGYTKLEDGTKIDSVANRMLLFDPSISHSSSTTTNQPVRMNINFNYF